jgi:uncharacterized protein
MIFFDPWYLVFVGPAVILGLWAQSRVRSTFSRAQKTVAPLSGRQAARRILDAAGLSHVDIQAVQGFLSDHYDSRHKVLRLSPDVYEGRTMAAVGVAAHEAGHALQDAQHYTPLVLRNMAVPVASFGGGISWILILLGLFLSQTLVWIGIIAFSGVVVFQLVNLPVEFNATTRAKEQLAALGIVHPAEQEHIRKVLHAAAWTYVAGTLQAVLTLLYFLFRFGGLGQQE